MVFSKSAKRIFGTLLTPLLSGCISILSVYPPHVPHIVPWHSVVSEQYKTTDTIHVSSWLYGFYEQELKYRNIKKDLNADSVFLIHKSALELLPIEMNFRNVKLTELDEEFKDDIWKKPDISEDFIKNHGIKIENEPVYIPIVKIFFGKAELLTPYMANEIQYSTNLLIWIVVLNKGEVTYRQFVYIDDRITLEIDEPYTPFKFEQHHWDSLVQIGFKEYIERME